MSDSDAEMLPWRVDALATPCIYTFMLQHLRNKLRCHRQVKQTLQKHTDQNSSDNAQNSPDNYYFYCFRNPAQHKELQKKKEKKKRKTKKKKRGKYSNVGYTRKSSQDSHITTLLWIPKVY